MTIVTRTKKTDPGGNEEIVQIHGIDRGMIFWAEVLYDETRGREQFSETPRPWLIVSSNAVHQRHPIVQAVPLTSPTTSKAESFRRARIILLDSHIHRLPVPQGKTGLPSGDSIALTEQLRVLAHSRLIDDPIGRLSKQALYSVEAALAFVLDLPSAIRESSAPGSG